MAKIISLKNQKEFDETNHSGLKRVGKYLIVVIAPTKTTETSCSDTKASKLGMKVGRKFGNAVSRNKFKRRIRAILLELSKNFINPRRFIVIPRYEARSASFKALYEDFTNICKLSSL